MTPLNGKLCHAYEDGYLTQPGCVIGEVFPGFYLVQFYEAPNGAATYQKLFPTEELAGWRFFDDDESWERAFRQEVGALPPALWETPR